MAGLPKPALFDSVGTSVPITRLPWWRRARCRHVHATLYTHIDHNVHHAAPDTFATTWHGMVCSDCGHVLTRHAPTPGDTTEWPLAVGSDE